MKSLVARERVEHVEDERDVVEVEVDAHLGHVALLAEPEERLREHVDVGRQHHVDRDSLGLLLDLFAASFLRLPSCSYL